MDSALLGAAVSSSEDGTVLSEQPTEKVLYPIASRAQRHSAKDDLQSINSKVIKDLPSAMTVGL